MELVQGESGVRPSDHNLFARQLNFVKNTMRAVDDL